MQRPFGSTFKLTLALSRPWLSLGPGWAMLAGALAGGYADFRLASLLKLLSLWLLVDPLLGLLWELAVLQGLWRVIGQAQLPPPAVQGFFVPYAQPDSWAGRLIRQVRRYRRWGREHYWPEFGDKFIAFGLGLSLILLIGLSLGSAILGLTCLAIGLILLAGQDSPDLATVSGGRLQSVVQLLIPWAMGTFLWSTLTPLSLALGLCYWVTYLGGLRMLGGHSRAAILFWLGQVAAILILLALRLLPGAAFLSVLLMTQLIIQTKFNQPADFLPKVQPYLVFSLLAAGFSLGAG